MFVIINENGQYVKQGKTLKQATYFLSKMSGTYWLFPKARPLLGWVAHCFNGRVVIREPGFIDQIVNLKDKGVIHE